VQTSNVARLTAVPTEETSMHPRARNLMLAEFAVKYCESVMSRGLGSFNQDFSLVHRILPGMPKAPKKPKAAPGLMNMISNYRAEWAYESERKEWGGELAKRTDEMRRVVKESREMQNSKIDYSGLGLTPEERAIMVGAEIEHSGLGNCGEQSRVAFKYLITRGAGGLAIVDWGKIVGRADGASGNHTFVVIGMDPMTPETSLATLAAPPQWGTHAVICDPWYHEWFAVRDPDRPTQWTAKMSRILSETQPTLKGGPWLDRGIAQQRGQLAAYDQMLAEEFHFHRLAYLAVVPPELKAMASQRFDGVSLRLRPTHPTPWRGHVL
jgi:hypothetical protein